MEANGPIDRFYSLIKDLIELHIRKKRVKSDSFPSWFSKKLKSLIIEKKIAHKEYKTTNSSVSYDKFKNLRSLSKTEADKCFDSYLKNVERSILENPKYFSKFVSKKTTNQEYQNICQ